MARKIVKAEVKQRITANKKVLSDCKKTVADFFKAPTNEGVTDARKAITSFIKATKAIESDSAKLATPETQGV